MGCSVGFWRFSSDSHSLASHAPRCRSFQSSPAVVDGTVYTGCRDSNLYAIDAATGKEKWRFNNNGSWVITSPAVTQGKVFFATSDSALYHVLDAATGKSVLQQEDKAYMFSSPAIAGDVVLVGVTNGTLEARDIVSGELLWDFRTEASKQNRSWILTADRKFNNSFLFRTSWQAPSIDATHRMLRVGSVFSSPLASGSTVYFGSTDGNLYAIE